VDNKNEKINQNISKEYEESRGMEARKRIT
jgi:hypothetical protein